MSMSKVDGSPDPTKPAKSEHSFSPYYRGSSTTLADDDFYKNESSKPNKYHWVDRLLGIVCAKVSHEKKSFTSSRCAQNGSVNDDGSSPWLVPVYVLSTRRDKYNHLLPMEAKCTIDTGNMQGNIISQKFVEDVLKYPRSAFCALTKEEEAGAIGITGHQLIPTAAIYLTWYHKKSTRVFRDMRFLISPNEQFDLIIGAGSIQRDKLLDVPNFWMGWPIPDIHGSDTAQQIYNKLDAYLEDEFHNESDKILRAKNEKEKNTHSAAKNSLKNMRSDFKDKARVILDNTKAGVEKQKEDMKKLRENIKDQLNGLPPYSEKPIDESTKDERHTSGNESKTSKSSSADQGVKRNTGSGSNPN